MRRVVLVHVVFLAVSGFASACGGESVSRLRDDAAAEVTGGTGGIGGTGGTAVGGTGATSDFAACEAYDECVVTTSGCCSGCEPLAFGDVVAVNAKHLEAFQATTCDPGVACGACADYAGQPMRPWYGAACRNGRCAPYDARAAALCSTDGDCHLRDGVGCCRGCRPNTPIVAISSEEILSTLACTTGISCPDCAGGFSPPPVVPICVEGLCAAAPTLR